MRLCASFMRVLAGKKKLFKMYGSPEKENHSACKIEHRYRQEPRPYIAAEYGAVIYIEEDKTDTELFGDKHTFYISIDPSDVLRRHMTGHIPEFGKFFHKYHQQIDQNTYDRQKDHRPFGTVGIRLSIESKMGGNLIRQMIPAQNKT